MMKVEVHMQGSSYPVELEEGATGKDLKSRFDLPALYYANGAQMNPDTPLKEGDKIEIMFAFGGG